MVSVALLHNSRADHSAPSQSYGAPSQSYGAPSPSYGPPPKAKAQVQAAYEPAVRYAGPIIYTDEMPPIIQFPHPPAQQV